MTYVAVFYTVLLIYKWFETIFVFPYWLLPLYVYSVYSRC